MQKPVPTRADEMTGAEVEPPPANRPDKRFVSTELITSAASSELRMGGRPRGGLELWRREWIRGLAIFTSCSILLLWAFRSEIGAAVDVWSASRTFGHAYFIFPVTLFVFYRLRHRLAKLQPKAAPLALVPIVGAMLFWAIGDLANLMVARQLAFVATWQSLFLLVFGWHAARASLFPLIYLYLAVPFGLSLIPTLQDITAQIVVRLLRFSGVPVFLEGYYIEIPNASFLVAEACSGVRYLMVCIALGVLAAYLFFRSWPRRILFAALAIIVPIVANGIRAYGIVMLAHFGRYEFAFDLDHVVYGFVFLSVVTLALLGLGALLRDGPISPLLDVPSRAVSLHTSGALETVALGRSAQTLCAVLAIAIIFGIHLWVQDAKAPPAKPGAALHGPVVAPPWVLDSEAPTWSPTFQGTDAKLDLGYRRGGERVGLHVGYYAYQREGAEAVSDLNTISGRSELKVLSSKQTEAQTAHTPLLINELVVLRDGRHFLVWYWYWIGGENTNSRLVGKLLEMKALATGGERAAAVIALSAEVSENVEGTTALLNSFLQEGLGGNGALFLAETSPARAAVSQPQSPPDTAGGAVNP